jgi:hypothetical protein
MRDIIPPTGSPGRGHWEPIQKMRQFKTRGEKRAMRVNDILGMRYLQEAAFSGATRHADLCHHPPGNIKLTTVLSAAKYLMYIGEWIYKHPVMFLCNVPSVASPE